MTPEIVQNLQEILANLEKLQGFVDQWKERVEALEEELHTERQFRLAAEHQRDRALEDLCALKEAVRSGRPWS